MGHAFLKADRLVRDSISCRLLAIVLYCALMTSFFLLSLIWNNSADVHFNFIRSLFYYIPAGRIRFTCDRQELHFYGISYLVTLQLPNSVFSLHAYCSL